MSKSVLISIQPKWCKLIAEGKKTVEVRKTKPKIDVPFKCYIYCTYGEGLIEFNDEMLPNHLIGYKVSKDKIWGNCCNGKVIGEFVCNEIEKLRYDALEMTYMARKYRDVNLLNEEFLKGTQVTYQEAYDYCEGMTFDEEDTDYFYGWHITDLVIYDKPKELGEFFYACKKPKGTDCSVCLDRRENRCKAITRPPQSWCYVEEV